MNKNQDLDLMIENFLSEKNIEDNGFSEKVLLNLPELPRWSWVNEMIPAFGVLAVVMYSWKSGLLSLHYWSRLVSQHIDWQSLKMTSLSFNVNLSLIIGVAISACFFLYEKYVEEI